MSEQLVEHELRRRHSHAERVEPALTAADLMDVLGDERLACPALAVQHDWCRSRSEYVRSSQHIRHGGRERDRIQRGEVARL
jgi:hypothetical protein